MIPVLKDSLIATRRSEGRFSIDSLLAYSSVCGTGLDTMPLPGDVTEETLVRIIGDMAVLALCAAKICSWGPADGAGPCEKSIDRTVAMTNCPATLLDA